MPRPNGTPIFAEESATTYEPEPAAATPRTSRPGTSPRSDPTRTPPDAEGPSAPVDIPPLPQTLMTVEDIGGMHFVRIDVPAVRERQAFALTDPLCDLAERTNGKMTLDLHKVAAFSYAWINVLLTVAKRCKIKGGNLVLTGVSTPCQQVLRQMGLHKQFTIVKGSGV